MTSKPFFQYAALAVISACIVIITLVMVQLLGQMINLAADYASSISRLIP